MANTVLIITNDHDVHVDAVVLELHKRNVPVFRFHPDDFPHACSISIEIQDGFIGGEIATRHRSVALTDICAAWFRRSSGIFEESISITSTELSDYIKQQTRATLATIYEGLETLWVGHPHK